jgi:predicted ATPase
MIKRIKVQNFLSLEDVDLDLRDRNTFVGPNMAGKSNLIECFRFLQEAVGRRSHAEAAALQQAFSGRGGFDELVWQGRAERTIRIELTAELKDGSDNRTSLYHYSVAFRHGDYGWPEVETEKLSVERREKRETLLENTSEGLKVTGQGNGAVQSAQNKQGLALEQYGDRSSSLSKIFADFVAGWRVYRLVPALMRTSNVPAWEKNLAEHGENLSAWLFRLQNHRSEFDSFKRAAQDALSGLAGILFQPVEPPKPQLSQQGQLFISSETAKISIGASETLFSKPISLARMSDGELVFLALLSLILAPEELRPTLLCIEEPENYLHPRLLEILIELLDQRATLADLPQIIATTHSPLLVDKLTLDELVVTDKVDGASKFSRASNKKRLKELLSRKELSLGDLWYSGALSDS